MPANTVAEPSVALQRAQEKLLTLRRRLPKSNSTPQPVVCEPDAVALYGQAMLERRRAGKQGGAGCRVPAELPAQAPRAPILCSHPEHQADDTPEEPDTVTVYPTLLTGMLKAEKEAAGRLYLLCKYLDTAGQGWVRIEDLREQLAKKDSPLRICGWRRLRQLFHEGNGIFWERDAERLWLYGPHKAAYTLNIRRLSGSRVQLPLAVLLGGIGAVRAHFYAAFHSGRGEEKPISRKTLQTITGVPERTQRAYDSMARVKRTRNFAIGARYSEEVMRRTAWQRGRGSFSFFDALGQQGGKNRGYVAWRLPNSYRGAHARRGRGRQRRVNQKLTDLVTHGRQGNGQGTIERVFWPDAKQAAKNATTSPSNDAYWPQVAPKHRDYQAWWVVSKWEE